MKYYKILIKQNQGSTKLIYPNKYESEVGAFSVDYLYYNDEQGKPRLVLCIEDVNSANILRDGIEEITEQELIDISEKNENRVEIFTDEVKIKRLEIKIRLNQPLSQEDMKSLDPEDKTPGFGKYQILADRIVSHKKIEILKRK